MTTLVYFGISADVCAIFEFLDRGFEISKMIGFDLDPAGYYFEDIDAYYNDIVRVLNSMGYNYTKSEKTQNPWKFEVDYKSHKKEIIIHYNTTFPIESDIEEDEEGEMDEQKFLHILGGEPYSLYLCGCDVPEYSMKHTKSVYAPCGSSMLSKVVDSKNIIHSKYDWGSVDVRNSNGHINFGEKYANECILCSQRKFTNMLFLKGLGVISTF